MNDFAHIGMMAMKSTLVKLFLSAILVIGAGDMVGTKTAFAARDCVALGCNDFVQANLRADLLDIYNSDDYEVLIQTSGQGNAHGRPVRRAGYGRDADLEAHLITSPSKGHRQFLRWRQSHVKVAY